MGMIAAICIVLAAICNAVMDKISHHFSTSVFAKLDPKFWDPSVSWKVAKRVFGWKFDAWHVAKSGMIVLLCVAVVLHQSPTAVFGFKVHWSIEFLIAGAIWNGVFNLFYNKIFAK